MQVAPKQKPTRKLTNWLTGYAQFTEHTEAPRPFHMWTGVSTIAAALNRKCWIDMGTFSLYPSFYIIMVAPPGIATKSTTASIGESLLRDADAIHLGASSMTWQAMLDELQESTTLIELPKEPMPISVSPIHIFASELGTFLQLKGDSGMLDALVDLWDGKPSFKRRTRSSGIVDIPRPYVNLLGCTTPGWLSSNAESYFVDGGFFSRTVFVYASEKDRLIAYPEDTLDHTLRESLLQDLTRIKDLSGEFKLSKEAKEWGTEWYEATYKSPPEHLQGEKFQSYLARRQTHLHKIAMVCSASEDNSLLITVEQMQMAEQMLHLAEDNLIHIHESIVTSDKMKSFTLLKKFFYLHKAPIEKNKLFREFFTRITHQEFEEALKALLFAGEVKQLQKNQITYIQHKGI